MQHLESKLKLELSPLPAVGALAGIKMTAFSAKSLNFHHMPRFPFMAARKSSEPE
jgi:hypothetical protein